MNSLSGTRPQNAHYAGKEGWQFQRLYPYEMGDYRLIDVRVDGDVRNPRPHRLHGQVNYQRDSVRSVIQCANIWPNRRGRFVPLASRRPAAPLGGQSRSRRLTQHDNPAIPCRAHRDRNRRSQGRQFHDRLRRLLRLSTF